MKASLFSIRHKVKPTLLLVLVLYVILQMQCCQSANHYCVNGHTTTILIVDLYHRDLTIIPEIPDEPMDKRGSYRDCSWEIIVEEAGNQNSQIVLEGVNLETEDLSGSSNKTQVNILLNRSENVTLGMFQVKPLSHMKHISVQINWDPKTQSRSPVNLRIMIPDVDLCSRDMLSFNGSCHAISTVPADITKAVERCIGDVSLASFTSMAHINEFITANEARQDKFPYKSPLDLSKWVRLGMFYRAGDGAIMSVVRTKSGCELMEVDKNIFQVSQMHLNGPCGSLKVSEVNKAAIQFGDCNETMLVLMSFPESAAKFAPASPLNCSKHLLHEIRLLVLLSKSAKFFSWPSHFSTATGNHENSHTQTTTSGYTTTKNSDLVLYTTVSIPLVAVTIFFFVLTVIGGIIWTKIKNRRQNLNVPTGSPQVETLAELEVEGQQRRSLPWGDAGATNNSDSNSLKSSEESTFV